MFGENKHENLSWNCSILWTGKNVWENILLTLKSIKIVIAKQIFCFVLWFSVYLWWILHVCDPVQSEVLWDHAFGLGRLRTESSDSAILRMAPQTAQQTGPEPACHCISLGRVHLGVRGAQNWCVGSGLRFCGRRGSLRSLGSFSVLRRVWGLHHEQKHRKAKQIVSEQVALQLPIPWLAVFKSPEISLVRVVMPPPTSYVVLH